MTVSCTSFGNKQAIAEPQHCTQRQETKELKSKHEARTEKNNNNSVLNKSNHSRRYKAEITKPNATPFLMKQEMENPNTPSPLPPRY